MTRWNRLVPYLIAIALAATVLAALGIPLAGLLPFAVVLVCPLMMIVMMQGMAGMHHGAHDDAGHRHEHGSGAEADAPSGAAR